MLIFLLLSVRCTSMHIPTVSRVSRKATSTTEEQLYAPPPGVVSLETTVRDSSYSKLDDTIKEEWDEILEIKGVERRDVETRREEVAKNNEEKSMISELTSFTLPLLLVWLSSPLLSLADSTFIGAFRSTSELAALGPACSMSDNIFFAATFVAVVTTSSVATAVANNDERGARAITSAGCIAALGIGLVLTAFLYGASPNILASCGELAPAAIAYVQNRCIGFTPGLISTSLQAASMARRDVRSPLLAALVAGGTNLIMDAILVPKYGLIGAAHATALAQYASLAVMLHRAYNWQNNNIDTLPIKQRPLILGWKDRLSPTFPRTISALKDCISNGTPVFGALLAKCAVCAGLVIAATRSAVGRGALPDAAAHQILTALYWLFAPVGDALSSTVQTFVPAARGKDAREQRSMQTTEYGKATKKVVADATKAALALGFVNALLAIALPTFAPFLFSRDQQVISVLLATVPLLGLNLMLHAATGALEGTMLAFKDTRRLSFFYALDATAVLAVFSVLATTQAPLAHVWFAFFGYQVVRAFQFAIRVRATVFSSKNTINTAPSSFLSAKFLFVSIRNIFNRRTSQTTPSNTASSPVP